MRRGGFLLAAGLPALAAAALGPLYGGHLTLDVPTLPRSLEPARPVDAGARLAAGLVHETLIRLDAEGRPRPGVASVWTGSASGRDWRLELSPQARFHGGAPPGADDVVRSLRRFLRSDSTAGAVLAGRLEGGVAFRSGQTTDLPGLASAGARLVQLRLERPALDPLAPLAAAAAGVTDARGRGCGPFAPALFEAGRRLELVAAAAHPAGRPFLDRVLVRATSSPSAPSAGGTTPLLLLLALDTTRPPFDAPERRRALAAAIDRQVLSERFLSGARPALGLGHGRRATTPRPPVGTPPAPVTIRLVVAMDVPAAASRRVVAHLAAARLTAETRPLPPGEARQSPGEARLLLWAPEVAEPGLALREAATLVRVPAVVERELRRAEAELDPDLRDEQLERAHAALLADASLIPLAWLPLAFGPPPQLLDHRVDATGTLRLDDAWLTR